MSDMAHSENENEEYNENDKNIKKTLNKVGIGMVSSAVRHFV